MACCLRQIHRPSRLHWGKRIGSSCEALVWAAVLDEVLAFLLKLAKMRLLNPETDRSFALKRMKKQHLFSCDHLVLQMQASPYSVS